MSRTMKLGFIGQGWIGKNLADHFEERGFETVRFAKEAPYVENKNRIAECDLVFIAVPTPTTPQGFDDSILRSVLPLVGKGKVAVIKSTVIIGTTDALQDEFPDIVILHAPEFLRETSVKHDIDYPDRNIIGVPRKFETASSHKNAVALLEEVLPRAPYTSVCTAAEAELTKYAGNNFLYTKVVFMNMLYDIAKHYRADWKTLSENMIADPRIGASHMQPVHQYAHMGSQMGRGAGGHCFIKDFAAFKDLYESVLPEEKETLALLEALENKNNQLLKDSGKDADLLEGVYG